ncbi:taste receptor type 2 member 9-like [Rhineura floridana]|uniref:taste receptor type 2 member 9-like n=1 Tax=Rhineura floridana TaxID=261503 RepID=UPI002AC842D4|nr:taste receptor type 2 member 9-like [Rhineura floridana]
MLDSVPLHFLFLIVTTAVIAVGVMGNGFITVASGLGWLRSKQLSPFDMILLALSLSRLLFLGITLSFLYSIFLDTDNPKPLPTPVMFLWAFFNAASLWIATCLAVFYCMKIANFTQPLLVKMKMRITSIVPHLLLGSVVASFLVSLPLIWLGHCSHCCNGTRVAMGDSNGTCSDGNFQMLCSAILYIGGTFPSFIICLAFSVFLIHSLLHHIKTLQQNAEGFRDQRMDVHLRAIKTLISFLLLYSAAFASEVSFTLFFSPWTVLISLLVVAAYHSGHAIVLIITNSKLKQAFTTTLCDTVCQSLQTTASPCHPKTPKGTCQS